MANAPVNEESPSNEKEQDRSEITGAIERLEEICLDDSELYGGDTDEEMEESDIDTNGENPIELEVEKYCQPSKRVILEEIENAASRRNLIVWPLTVADMDHLIVKECISKCSEFKFSFCSSEKGLKNLQNKTWSGMLKLVFHSSFDAEDMVGPLKTFREDINVLIPASKSDISQTTNNWRSKNASLGGVSIKDLNMMVIKNLPRETTLQELRKLIPSSIEAIIPSSENKDANNQPQRIALVFFSTVDDLNKVLEEHMAEPLKVGPNQTELKLLSYQPPQLPNGLLKMDRRYKEMVQLKQLKKLYKEKSANLSQDQKTKLMDSIKRSRNFLERDNNARTELNLPLHSWKELRRIKRVRDSIPTGTQWLPFATLSKEKFANLVPVGRPKKRRVDQRNNVNNQGQPPIGGYLRNETFSLPHSSSLADRTIGKDHWMIPFNFGLYNQMANMMNHVAFQQPGWPIYGSGGAGFYQGPMVRGHNRGRFSNRGPQFRML